MQRDRCAKTLSAALVHGVGAAAVALPVHRLRAFLIGQGIDGHKACHHEGTVKSKSEMADDLIVACLVLVLRKEGLRAGEGDVVDILLDLVSRHADTVIGYCDGSVIGVHLNINPGLIIIRQGKISHHVELFKLGDRITAIGDQLPVEDIVIAVQPLLDNGKHILAVNRQ